MDDTKSPQVGLWFAIAGVSGVIALFSGAVALLRLSLLLSFSIPYGRAYVLFFSLAIVVLLSIAVFVAALTKRSGLALYGSIAILFSSAVWRLFSVAAGGDFINFLPFLPLFSEFAFQGFFPFFNAAYVALDIVLAGALLVLTILQHRRRQPSEFGSPLRGGAAGRASGTILCKMCGTPGVANQFCQGCGSKLQPPV